MNNEEKILSLLETLSADVSGLKAGVADLQAGQAKLESDLESVRASVVRIENEHGKKLDALFDGYQQLDGKITRIEERVSAQDEVILKRVFPKTVGE